MDALEDLRSEIKEAATAEGLSDGDRVTRLESIRDDLQEALDDVEAKIAEAVVNRDSARPADIEIAIAALRSRAEAAQESLDDGSLTEADLTEAGVFTTAELDLLADEDLLEATAQELIEAGKIDVSTGEWVIAAA